MREDDEGLARKIICSLQMSLRGRYSRMPVADGQWSALEYGPKLSPFLATVWKVKIF